MTILVWSLTLGLLGMSGTTCIAPKITVTLKPYHDDNVGKQSLGIPVLPYAQKKIKKYVM